MQKNKQTKKNNWNIFLVWNAKTEFIVQKVQNLISIS